MKRTMIWTLATLGLLAVLAAGKAQAATIDLYEIALNVDGTVDDTFPGLGDPLPSSSTSATFAYSLDSSYLGSLVVTLSGAGTHYVGAFLDYEIDETINTYYNEYGATGGTLSTGQSWEIDEPGWVFGDIFANFGISTLDNSNAVPAAFEDDVSVALGWDFTLAAGETAAVSFLISETAPGSGFYLIQTDPDSQYSIYFSSDLRVSGGSGGGGHVVPFPPAALLALPGLGLIAALRRRRNRQ